LMAMYVTVSHALRMPMKTNSTMPPAMMKSAPTGEAASVMAPAEIAPYPHKGEDRVPRPVLEIPVYTVSHLARCITHRIYTTPQRPVSAVTTPT